MEKTRPTMGLFGVLMALICGLIALTGCEPSVNYVESISIPLKSGLDSFQSGTAQYEILELNGSIIIYFKKGINPATLDVASILFSPSVAVTGNWCDGDATNGYRTLILEPNTAWVQNTRYMMGLPKGYSPMDGSAPQTVPHIRYFKAMIGDGIPPVGDGTPPTVESTEPATDSFVPLNQTITFTFSEQMESFFGTCVVRNITGTVVSNIFPSGTKVQVVTPTNTTYKLIPPTGGWGADKIYEITLRDADPTHQYVGTIDRTGEPIAPCTYTFTTQASPVLTTAVAVASLLESGNTEEAVTNNFYHTSVAEKQQITANINALPEEFKTELINALSNGQIVFNGRNYCEIEYPSSNYGTITIIMRRFGDKWVIANF
jgi:hypothetical protein